MRMILRYQSGTRVEVVLLAAGGDRLRAAVESQRDTAELHRTDGRWYTERGAPIEIEAVIPIVQTDFPDFCAAVYPRAFAGFQSRMF
jgi:hypothetical protein